MTAVYDERERGTTCIHPCRNATTSWPIDVAAGTRTATSHGRLTRPRSMLSSTSRSAAMREAPPSAPAGSACTWTREAETAEIHGACFLLLLLLLLLPPPPPFHSRLLCLQASANILQARGQVPPRASVLAPVPANRRTFRGACGARARFACALGRQHSLRACAHRSSPFPASALCLPRSCSRAPRSCCVPVPPACRPLSAAAAAHPAVPACSARHPASASASPRAMRRFGVRGWCLLRRVWLWMCVARACGRCLVRACFDGFEECWWEAAAAPAAPARPSTVKHVPLEPGSLQDTVAMTQATACLTRK